MSQDRIAEIRQRLRSQDPPYYNVDVARGLRPRAAIADIVYLLESLDAARHLLTESEARLARVTEAAGRFLAATVVVETEPSATQTDWDEYMAAQTHLRAVLEERE